MALILEKNLGSISQLVKEGIEVELRETEFSRDYFKVLVVNLMPTKVETETQLLRYLGRVHCNLWVDFLYTSTHKFKNIDEAYLKSCYRTIGEVKNEIYNGIIITGAPLEQIDFEEVDYWEELQEIMDYASRVAQSTLFICWGAQAGLYHYYGVPKEMYEQKIFGVFNHRVNHPNSPIVRGFDTEFKAPHSRYSGVPEAYLKELDGLEILAQSEEAGVYLVASKDGRQVFVTGHSEYAADTLKKEYDRDVLKGLAIGIPKNYFPENNPKKEPVVKWRAHGTLLFENWVRQFSKCKAKGFSARRKEVKSLDKDRFTGFRYCWEWSI